MITEKELFDQCQDFLGNIGVPSSSVTPILDKEKYDAALVSSLSPVNIVKANRISSKSNQTHIHITGDAMQVFYPSYLLDSVIQSTADEEIKISMFAANFSHLKYRYNSVKGNPNVESTDESPDQILNMSTVKKVSLRRPASLQVQISKVAFDSDNFTELRQYLFEGDSLYFFKDAGSYDSYFLVAIPNENDLVVKNTKQKHTLVRISRPNAFILNEVTPDTIASVTEGVMKTEYSLADEDAQVNAIELRLEKNRQHQAIVKRLAQKILESSPFKIMAGNIDCFAVDKGINVSLIFEVKTLDPSSEFSSEISQVRKAFAQLFYYEALAKNEFHDVPSKKIAVFNRAISDQHIEFFVRNNCSVIWLENNEFLYTGNDEVISSIFNVAPKL